MTAPKITVVGSLNMDMTTTTTKVPGPGETVLGTSFATAPGGKGANQAVAAAKLGADVTMVGCIGDDPYGELLLQNLREQGVDFVHKSPVEGVSTGVAQITVSAGENRIIVAPGTNHYLTPEILSQYEDVIAASDVVLTQLEIPFSTVEATVDLAAKHDVAMILNPAPAQSLPESLLEKTRILTPNEHEFKQLFKQEMPPHDLDVVITKGDAGAVHLGAHGETPVSGFSVEATDTTGAGDAFNGGLAYALGSGQSMAKALRFANAVAAIAVTKPGAQAGMPEIQEVEAFLAAHE